MMRQRVGFHDFPQSVAKSNFKLLPNYKEEIPQNLMRRTPDVWNAKKLLELLFYPWKRYHTQSYTIKLRSRMAGCHNPSLSEAGFFRNWRLDFFSRHVGLNTFFDPYKMPLNSPQTTFFNIYSWQGKEICKFRLNWNSWTRSGEFFVIWFRGSPAKNWKTRTYYGIVRSHASQQAYVQIYDKSARCFYDVSRS